MNRDVVHGEVEVLGIECRKNAEVVVAIQIRRCEDLGSIVRLDGGPCQQGRDVLDVGAFEKSWFHCHWPTGPENATIVTTEQKEKIKTIKDRIK